MSNLSSFGLLRMKTIIKVALIAFLWTTVVNSGGFFGNGDTAVRLQMAHAWWTGTEEVSPDYQPTSRLDNYIGVIDRKGKRRQIYESGQSLLMLPGDWLGTQLNQWFPQIASQDLRVLVVSLLIFVPINVAVVVSCFWLLRLFNFNESIAGLSSLTWLLGTTVLHYSQVHQQNNQILLFVTLGYGCALAYVQTRQLRFAFLSGLSLGGSILIRTTTITHALTVFLFLVGCLIYQSRDKFQIIKGVCLWIVGLIPLALLGRILDYLRFGSFWTTGYSLYKQQLQIDPIYAKFPELPPDYPFIYPPHVGILGVLFSLKKSIFIYDPLLLPCLILAIAFWKRFSPYIQLYFLSGILNLALHIIITSRLDFWHGDGAWGARYHVTSVHLLLIPLLAVFIEYLLSIKGWKLWLMRLILTVAIIAQIASVMLFCQLEARQTTFGIPGSRLEFRLTQRVTNIICLIDDSLSKGCVSKYKSKFRNKKYEITALERYSKLPFFPFTFSREIKDNPPLKRLSFFLFLVWGLALILAVVTTVWFCFAV